ncbi:MAG: hypothetical protein ABIK81_00365 [candidate division WOR-3 bacterium]
MVKKIKKEEKKRESRRLPNISFKKKNYLLLLLAIIVIIAGFVFLGRGSITLAPILLVIGYCVLVPLAILLK